MKPGSRSSTTLRSHLKYKHDGCKCRLVISYKSCSVSICFMNRSDENVKFYWGLRWDTRTNRFFNWNMNRYNDIYVQRHFDTSNIFFLNAFRTKSLALAALTLVHPLWSLTNSTKVFHQKTRFAMSGQHHPVSKCQQNINRGGKSSGFAPDLAWPEGGEEKNVICT